MEFLHIIEWDVSFLGKIRKNKMCVLSCQSFYKNIRIVEKNATTHFKSLIFPIKTFFSILQY